MEFIITALLQAVYFRQVYIFQNKKGDVSATFFINQ